MNTPLGVQGRDHQKRRDKLEASLKQRYGDDINSSLESKIKVSKRVKQAKDFLHERVRSARKAAELLKNGGHFAAA